jgi:anti-sigma regulatory factor (Ser/Thr protein kinase)
MYLENIDFKFCVPTELSSLVIIRNNIEESISPLSISEDTIFDIELSENEFANDFFIHGYKGASGLIEIYLWRDADSVIVTFSDQG